MRVLIPTSLLWSPPSKYDKRKRVTSNEVTRFLFVESRVGEINILLVHLFSGQFDSLAETLEVYDLALKKRYILKFWS